MSDALEWYYTISNKRVKQKIDNRIDMFAEIGIPAEEAIEIAHDEFINGDVVFYGEE